jgi:transposase
VVDHATLEVIAEALLAVRAVLAHELWGLEKRLRRIARGDGRAFADVGPGVRAIFGLTFCWAIDDPARFRSSKQVGAHFGLTPKRYQSVRPT